MLNTMYHPRYHPVKQAGPAMLRDCRCCLRLSSAAGASATLEPCQISRSEKSPVSLIGGCENLKVTVFHLTVALIDGYRQ
jgi:hypothetical protein